jgi:hypothetical protein
MGVFSAHQACIPSIQSLRYHGNSSLEHFCSVDMYAVGPITCLLKATLSEKSEFGFESGIIYGWRWEGAMVRSFSMWNIIGIVNAGVSLFKLLRSFRLGTVGQLGLVVGFLLLSLLLI